MGREDLDRLMQIDEALFPPVPPRPTAAQLAAMDYATLRDTVLVPYIRRARARVALAGTSVEAWARGHPQDRERIEEAFDVYLLAHSDLLPLAPSHIQKRARARVAEQPE